MKKIGEGWQYTVYDLGNGRVLKKFHSTPRSYWVIIKTIFPFKNDPLWKIFDYSRGMKRTAIESFSIIKNKNIPASWMANPEFVSELDFEQDKVESLAQVFDKCSVEEGKKLVDKFVEFNKKLFSFGIIDKSFNITKNYGMDINGGVVLIDIGEIFDNKEKIEQQRRERAWAKFYVCDEIKNWDVRDYFLRKMDEEFGLKPWVVQPM